ncbi:hypothetical protein DRP05_03105 [Archaeoglobales archaeon]|nr:MAG: hypothetical protein DRP05_03105 [Archaeoglobales archaeon]
MSVVICDSCGRESEDLRQCSVCKKNLCSDCARYMVVKRKTIYKEFEDSIPVCKDCLPTTSLKKKLVDIVDAVLGR